MKSTTLGLIAIVVYGVFRLVFDYLADMMQIEDLRLGGVFAGALALLVVAVVLLVRGGKKK